MGKIIKWWIVIILIISIIIVGIGVIILTIEEDYVEGEIIVRFKGSVTLDEAIAFVEQIDSIEPGDVYIDLTNDTTFQEVNSTDEKWLVRGCIGGTRACVVHVPIGLETYYIEIFESSNLVFYAELNKIGTVA